MKIILANLMNLGIGNTEMKRGNTPVKINIPNCRNSDRDENWHKLSVHDY